MVAWAVASLGFDAAAFLQSQRGQNNHLIVYLSTIVLPVLTLLALSGWQSGLVRTAYQIAIPLLALVSLLLIAVFEQISTFSRVASPFEALTVAVASAGVLIIRSLNLDTRPLWREDWFWACTGLLLRSATGASLAPLAAHFIATDPGRVIVAYEITSAVDAVAAAAIAGAILCPIQASGRSS